MKGHHCDFRQLKDHTTPPPPVRRARGGRTEMRVSGNPDVYKEVSGDAPYAADDLKAPGARGKRRAARTRDGKARDAVSGAPVKHRADRRARGVLETRTCWRKPLPPSRTGARRTARRGAKVCAMAPANEPPRQFQHAQYALAPPVTY
jgi:hypothetical protein